MQRKALMRFNFNLNFPQRGHLAAGFLVEARNFLELILNVIMKYTYITYINRLR